MWKVLIVGWIMSTRMLCSSVVLRDGGASDEGMKSEIYQMMDEMGLVIQYGLKVDDT